MSNKIKLFKFLKDIFCGPWLDENEKCGYCHGYGYTGMGGPLDVEIPCPVCCQKNK